MYRSNPNFPPRQKFLTSNQRDRFEPSYVQWPAYDRHSQKYLNIGELKRHILFIERGLVLLY